jgi:hypothetical protein
VRLVKAGFWHRKVTWYAGMVGVTVPASFLVEPRILLFLGGAGFTMRGLGTLAELRLAELKGHGVGQGQGRLQKGIHFWNGVSLVFNATSQVHSSSTSDTWAQAHYYLGNPQPSNFFYGIWSEGNGVERWTKLFNQKFKLSGREDYFYQAAGTAANWWLFVDPTNKPLFISSALFTAGSSFRLARRFVTDFRSWRSAGASGSQTKAPASASPAKDPLLDRIAIGVSAAGLLSYGIFYLMLHHLQGQQAASRPKPKPKPKPKASPGRTLPVHPKRPTVTAPPGGRLRRG